MPNYGVGGKLIQMVKILFVKNSFGGVEVFTVMYELFSGCVGFVLNLL